MASVTCNEDESANSEGKGLHGGGGGGVEHGVPDVMPVLALGVTVGSISGEKSVRHAVR